MEMVIEEDEDFVAVDVEQDKYVMVRRMLPTQVSTVEQ